MSNYTKGHFARCQFNPMTGEEMLAGYPVLQTIISDELMRDSRRDALIRYIIMVYDPESPLVASERDLNFRKAIAAELANLPLNDEEFIQAIYNCSLPGLVDMTCKYLVRFARSKEWAAICAYEYKFWEAIRLIMQPIASDKSDREQLDAANKKDVLSDSIDQ